MQTYVCTLSAYIRTQFPTYCMYFIPHISKSRASLEFWEGKRETWAHRFPLTLHDRCVCRLRKVQRQSLISRTPPVPFFFVVSLGMLVIVLTGFFGFFGWFSGCLVLWFFRLVRCWLQHCLSNRVQLGWCLYLLELLIGYGWIARNRDHQDGSL